VIGELRRALRGAQFGSNFPLFVHYGVPLWVPEVGGAIDPDNEAHDWSTDAGPPLRASRPDPPAPLRRV
jgi:hypothetical protein